MKRSDAIHKIDAAINYMLDVGIQTTAAEHILSEIEKMGMIPPYSEAARQKNYVKWLAGQENEGKFNGNCWDPEE